MSVTRENRKIRDYLRKRLSRLVAATGGEIHERAGAGGKIFSTYKWHNKRGERTFRISWHNSVSDRYYPRKIRAEIQRKLLIVSELFHEEPSAKSKILSPVGRPGRASLATTYQVGMIEWRWSQFIKPFNDFRIWLIGPSSVDNDDYWDEVDGYDDDFPKDFLSLLNMGWFGPQSRPGQEDIPDDIFAFGTGALFIFNEVDELSMIYANRSLIGWFERQMFWWRRRNPKFYDSNGVKP